MPTRPSKHLETFPNPRPERDYIIEITAPEFTCLCPKTGQPDFATLYLEYVPDRLCVELKSLKLYIWSYRDEGHFHEDVTNRIADDLLKALDPRYLRLRAEFNVRGGIYTTVEVEHRRPDWRAPPPPPPADLPRETHEWPPSQNAAVQPPPRRQASISTTTVAGAGGGAPTASENRRFRMLRRARPPVETVRPVHTPAEEASTAEVSAPPPPPPPPKRRPEDGIYIGLDLGSTGCRAVAVDHRGEPLVQAQAPIAAPVRSGAQVSQDPTLWWKAASHCLKTLLGGIDAARVQAIAVDGTSGTVLLTDDKGTPVTPAIMYNDQRADAEAERIAAVADSASAAQGATSALAKLLWLSSKKVAERAAHVLHQADWVTGRLLGRYGLSDVNNCLKLGYDPLAREWPKWLSALSINTRLLPEVHEPGETLGTISPEIAREFGLPADTRVVAGTTDGVAAFLAAGATRPGHGVTSLGSTLVLKLLSDKPVFSPEHGVYSHRLGKYWLAGGASNSGGAVLLQYFKLEQIRELSTLLDPEHSTGLDYYPLPDVGERFPINDPKMAPRLEPLPGDSVTFLQGMLEGIANIEARGYALLHELGAPAVTDVWTTGGGTQNLAWQRIRARILGVPIHRARSDMAAYGTALLAAGWIGKVFQ
jgi:7-cyano-7-deazaguanine reductase